MKFSLFRKSLFVFFLFVSFYVFTLENSCLEDRSSLKLYDEPSPTRLILTVPKAGTHLMQKLLMNMSEQVVHVWTP
jgi:hypothetical protein